MKAVIIFAFGIKLSSAMSSQRIFLALPRLATADGRNFRSACRCLEVAVNQMHFDCFLDPIQNDYPQTKPHNFEALRMNVLNGINNLRLAQLECHDLRSGPLPPAALYWDDGYCRFLLKNLRTVSDVLDEFTINYEWPSHPLTFDYRMAMEEHIIRLGDIIYNLECCLRLLL
jgi:hypothetical protein